MSIPTSMMTPTQAFIFSVPNPEWFLPFAKSLSPFPWMMLLHSGDTEHEDSRFDILVSHPIATIETQLFPNPEIESIHGVEIKTQISFFKHTTSLKNYSQELLSSSLDKTDPFDCLERVLARVNMHALPDENIPFQGGALGMFSYDLGRTQENIPNLSLKLDRLPAMSIGIYDLAWIYDHKTGSFTCVIQSSHFDDAKCRFDVLLQEMKEIVTGNFSVQQSTFQLTQKWQPYITQAEYETQFQAVQEALHAGECYQVNLTQAFISHYQGDEWGAFLDLLKMNQAPFSAFCHVPQGKVLSASPERFLLLKGQEVSTKPIKGTMPRSIDPKEDEQNKMLLASSEKNQAENVMIVDLLRNDLGKIAEPGTVDVPKLFSIESFPAVHHLVSTVSARLSRGISAVRLLKACFPGGSITGAPKVSAMKKIEMLEPTSRSIYCGSIAYFSACGRMDSNIAIRTLIAEPDEASAKEFINCCVKEPIILKNQGKLFCFAGGGIVLESEAGDEYSEVYAKLSKILSLW